MTRRCNSDRSRRLHLKVCGSVQQMSSCHCLRVTARAWFRTFCGRILRAKDGQPANGITVVVVPLNMIQYDQVASLAKHGITVCKMDIEGNTSCATNEDEAYDKVTIIGELKIFVSEWLFTQPINWLSRLCEYIKPVDMTSSFTQPVQHWACCVSKGPNLHYSCRAPFSCAKKPRERNPHWFYILIHAAEKFIEPAPTVDSWFPF